MSHQHHLAAITLTGGLPALQPIAAPLPWQRWAVAGAYGLLCHGVFAVGIAAMAVGLFSGLQSNLTGLTGGWGWALNAVLVLQFPVLHSYFLTPPGRRVLRRLAPASAGATLDTTLFATASAAQLLLVFALWAPMGATLWQASGLLWWTLSAAFALSWVLLVVALAEAGLGVQSGSTGWLALSRGERPRYPSFATAGLHSLVRHPIYAAFALILWTGPMLSVDKVALAAVWTLYCLRGPRRKEARYLARYGEAYAAYAAVTPAFVPSLSSLRAALRRSR